MYFDIKLYIVIPQENKSFRCLKWKERWSTKIIVKKKGRLEDVGGSYTCNNKDIRIEIIIDVLLYNN